VDNELEVIQSRMEETRASLADKLEALENQVLGTVSDATSAVANTVEDVKSVVGSVTESVQETVESVKETFNLRKQFEKHPWLLLGGSVAVGYVGGCLLSPSSRTTNGHTAQPAAELPTAAAPSFLHQQPQAAPPAPASQPAEEPGAFHEALHRLRGLAVGSLMGVVRQMLTTTLPEALTDDVSHLVDDFTTSLGGKPIRGSLLPENNDR